MITSKIEGTNRSFGIATPTLHRFANAPTSSNAISQNGVMAFDPSAGHSDFHSPPLSVTRINQDTICVKNNGKQPVWIERALVNGMQPGAYGINAKAVNRLWTAAPLNGAASIYFRMNSRDQMGQPQAMELWINGIAYRYVK